MVLLLFALLLPTDSVQILSHTETYKPFVYNVAVLENGHIYFINSEKQVIHFDESGKKIGSFGGEGDGPGEFRMPIYLGVQNQTVWVYDILKGAASEFTLDGELKHVYQSEKVGSRIVKTAVGYAFEKYFLGESSPAKINLVDQTLKEITTVMEWTPEWIHPGRVARLGERVSKVNPAKEQIRLVSDPTGKFLYITHPGLSFKITVFDVMKGKISHHIKRDDQAVPFNKEWGMAQIKKGAGGASLDAPKYFPLIRGLSVSPSGKLVVVKWTWDPDIKDHFLVLDHHGKEATLNYAPQNQGRVIAIYSDTAYLSGYDDESGEATIIKCSSDKIDQTINHHPLVYQKKKKLWSPVKL